MFVEWTLSKGWRRLFYALMITTRPMLQLRSLRHKISLQLCSPYCCSRGLCVLARWRTRRTALYVWKYWLCEMENQIQLRRNASKRMALVMSFQLDWSVITFTRTFWMLPSPGGTGTANHLRLSSTSRSMMLLIAVRWSISLQYHPSSLVMINNGDDPVRRRALLDRTILIMPRRLRVEYDVSAPCSLSLRGSGSTSI